MTLAPYENLKGFASARPPLVIFVACLGLFGLVLMSLAYYVKLAEIDAPEPSQNWNTFLENFADLEFCIANNFSSVQATTVEPAPQTKGLPLGKSLRESPSPSTEATTPVYDGPRNYSISMLLTVMPTKEFLSIPHNLTHLSGTIIGADIGLRGQAANEEVNVTMELPYEWNSTHCQNEYKCDEVQIYACVHLQAAPMVFPPSRSPQMCESINDTGIEYSARILSQHSHMYMTHYCRSKPLIKLHYKLDAGMTVWLNLHDRSVINLHLMHTSYFLFVMVMMVFCYATIKGRPHIKRVHAENGYAPAPDHD